MDVAAHACLLCETIISSIQSEARSFLQTESFDFLIVGAGFAGSALAERLARGSGKRVLLIDKRSHIGGNAYDEVDAAGVLMHRYGPHIFHTNSDEIVAYLSRFTRWRPYEHRVLAEIGDGLLAPIPINRTTLNKLYGLSLASDEEADAFFESRAEPTAHIPTSEDWSYRRSAAMVLIRLRRSLNRRTLKNDRDSGS